MDEQEREQKNVGGEAGNSLPSLVDNSGKFPTVEEETSPALTRPAIPPRLVYPKPGDMLYFKGQRFEVISELNRHRFVIKWRG